MLNSFSCTKLDFDVWFAIQPKARGFCPCASVHFTHQKRAVQKVLDQENPDFRILIWEAGVYWIHSAAEGGCSF